MPSVFQKSASGSTSSETVEQTLNENCLKCKKKLGVGDKECMSCDGCNGWVHLVCVGITSNDAKVITKLESKGVRYLCRTCLSGDNWTQCKKN